ncbi:MAG: PEP-CTERM sorting domain-containing protein, partial [bacterium]|nr:PEP-CTERM sorting domain-containing protein [bacterium]
PTPPGYPAGNFYPGTDVDGNPVVTEHTGPHPEAWPAFPEPSSLVLLSLGGLFAARRRRS